MALHQRALLILLLSFWGPISSADQPFTVYEVQAGNEVAHGVEVRSVIDASRHPIDLQGPSYIATSGDLCVSWYSIQNPLLNRSTVGVMSTNDVGEQSLETLQLGAAEWLLIPAQTLGDGAPSPVPDDWDILTAYRVQPSDGDATPQYVCVPTAQWHHHDKLTIHHPNRGWLVTAVPEKTRLGTKTILDGFGLNSLRVRSVSMLAQSVTLSFDE
ncbi:MAG: hypothetical protein AAF670_19355 [Planctomycetota bacterium]